MRTTKIILCTSAIALAAPGVAAAHHGSGTPGGTYGDPVAKHCHGHKGHGHAFGFGHRHGRTIAGIVVSKDATAKTVTISVGRAATRHHGGATTPKQITLDVSAAKIRATDTDGDGTPNELDDVRVGDKVFATSAKRAKAGTPVPVRALVDWTTAKAAKHRR